jgi:hypothetical protein
MELRPLPYLLAVATASNIGSVTTITGNPQNMLIGSLWATDPVLRHPLSRLSASFGTGGPGGPGLGLGHPRLFKPGLLILLVLAGFFAGVPPAVPAALGAPSC